MTVGMYYKSDSTTKIWSCVVSIVSNIIFFAFIKKVNHIDIKK